jgi:hypothetical protein
MGLGPRSSALTAVPQKPGQMMTPDKRFLFRSHVTRRHDSLNKVRSRIAVVPLCAHNGSQMRSLQTKRRHFPQES